MIHLLLLGRQARLEEIRRIPAGMTGYHQHTIFNLTGERSFLPGKARSKYSRRHTVLLDQHFDASNPRITQKNLRHEIKRRRLRLYLRLWYIQTIDSFLKTLSVTT